MLAQEARTTEELRERRGSTVGEPIIKRGEKGKVPGRYERAPSRRRQSDHRRRATGVRSLMLELSDKAVMRRALRVLVQEIVKLRRNLQRTNPGP